MNITVIVLVTIILILLYGLFVLYYYGNKSTLISSKVFLKNGTKVIDITNKPQYKSFSYSLWVYLNTDVGTPLFNVMQMTKSGTYISNSVSISGNEYVFGLHLINNKLVFAIDTSNVVMNPFTKQRWVNIFINSFENEYYEIYINGKLIKTIKYVAPIDPTATSNIVLGDSGNQDVVITKLVRFIKPLDSYSVWKNYLEGNGMSYNKYNASLEVKQETDTLYNFKLFG